MYRSFISALLVIALFALAAPALAGGWATVRLDEPPGDVLAGVPWRFGFMVLQHDVTPNSDVTPVVRAVHRETAEEVTAPGRQEGAAGHFVAELTLPRAGAWKWSISPEPYAATSFETLIVRERSGVAPGGDVDRAGIAIPQAEEDLAAPQSAATIEILDSALFQPASLDVAPGTTVTWVNRSSIAHTVTSEHLGVDDSGLIEPGESFSVRFAEPGAYRYHCAPHPGMEGVVVVA